ncbi:MAG: DoxX family protein [Balneolales bacterium]|nr:DoxX family protein [Balneolales bacterium]
MSTKTSKVIYWISTGLLSLMMLMSAFMYLFNNAQVSEVFVTLGFPTFIIYPLAIAKVLGIIVLWVRKPMALTEWAYAGFFFDFLLALSAHLVAQDGEFGGALAAIILLFTSYFSGKRAFSDTAEE